MKRIFAILAFTVAAMTAISIDARTFVLVTTMPNVFLANINPPSGSIGQSVILSGSGFKSSLGANKVFFHNAAGTVQAIVLAATPTQLTVKVPSGAVTGGVHVQVGNAQSNSVVFTVVTPPANVAPVVNAGADQAITLPASVNLSGTATDDGLPNGGWLSVAWSVVSGPASVTFGSASALNTSASFTLAGVYTLRLTVSDGSLSTSDDVLITVSDPPPGIVTVFPPDNVWNTPVNALPVQRPIDGINDHGGHPLHPDFGTIYNGLLNGIPVNTVAGNSIPPRRVNVTTYASESDALPGGDQTTGFLPIPPNVVIEGDPVSSPTWTTEGDHHLLLLDTDTHLLHELYKAIRQPDGSIMAASYAHWDLDSNALRPDGFTSADAAGLPVLPGLVRYDEIQSRLAVDPTGITGDLGHALRFTLDLTHGPHIWPARHDANSGGLNNPPLGLRVRLKSGFDTSGYSPTNKIILNTFKKYGALLSDNGGDWFFQGVPDSRWDDNDLHILIEVIPSDSFEVVDTSGWIVDANSGQANPAGHTGGSLILTDSNIDQVITIESSGQFRLVFEAGDNAGLSQWYDLVNDPSAQNNLAGPAYGVNQGDITVAEPGLFQQVFYGTTPNDPKLYTRAAKYYFPSSPRSFQILENTAARIVLEAISHPIAGSTGVLSNITGKVKYTIYPDGRIYIHSEITAQNPQTIDTWFNAIMGLQNPGGTGSIPPDTAGWIRATASQNPYNYTEVEEVYVFAYWSPNTPAPNTDFSKASILLIPRADNPYHGGRTVHSWENFLRWGYAAANIVMTAGQTIAQDYLMQLGTQGSALLPDIRTIPVADGISSSYQSNPIP
jgi:hypothetical protein